MTRGSSKSPDLSKRHREGEMWSWGGGTLEMCWRIQQNGGGSCEKEEKKSRHEPRKRKEQVIEMREGRRKLLSYLFSIHLWLIAPAKLGRYKPLCALET